MLAVGAPAGADTVIGFEQGTSVGSGFSSLTLTVKSGSTTVLQQTFASVAAADAYFTDNPVDIGSYASALLKISVQETFTAANSGYDFGFLVGEVPSSSPSSDRATAAHTALGDTLLAAALGGAATDVDMTHAAKHSAAAQLAAATGAHPHA